MYPMRVRVRVRVRVRRSHRVRVRVRVRRILNAKRDLTGSCSLMRGSMLICKGESSDRQG